LDSAPAPAPRRRRRERESYTHNTRTQTRTHTYARTHTHLTGKYSSTNDVLLLALACTRTHLFYRINAVHLYTCIRITFCIPLRPYPEWIYTLHAVCRIHSVHLYASVRTALHFCRTALLCNTFCIPQPSCLFPCWHQICASAVARPERCVCVCGESVRAHKHVRARAVCMHECVCRSACAYACVRGSTPWTLNPNPETRNLKP